MFQNESTASARRIPIRMRSSSTGVYTASLTLTGAEVQISVNGAAFTNAAGTASEVGGAGNGSGSYYYEATSGEVATLGYFEMKIAKTGYEPWNWIETVEPAIAATIATIGTNTSDIPAAILDVLTGDHNIEGTIGAAIQAPAVIDPVDLADAVNDLILVGSHTLGDLSRLQMAVNAGPVSDFTTGTQVYRCPVTGTVRLTVTTDATGRLTSTLGDLT